jgi:hypothetical protein
MDWTQTFRTFSGSIFSCSARWVESVHCIPSIGIVSEDIYVTLKIPLIPFCAELLGTQFSHGMDPNLSIAQRKYIRIFREICLVAPLYPSNRTRLQGQILDSEKSAHFIPHPDELVSLSHVIPKILVT